ncbi:MAG TPA: hypothetical protein VKK31_15690 [Thermoanaerobaculia bacterium]|nr:hypothetical protein [Thermoanaerobaculia bacterium]
MRRRILFLLISALAGHLHPLSAIQYGFADSGFQIASIRTVYDDGYEGTSLNPLTLTSPCLWGTSIGGCPTGPVIYSASNWWRQNWVDICGPLFPCTFWLLQMNNEPAFNNCNPGPPDASLPRSEPGHGIMGFTAIKGSLVGEAFYRAHLVLNLTYPNPCDGGYGIPFLSIAADRDRGNGGRTPGALNRSSTTIPNRVRFTARLWDLGLPSCPSCVNGFVQPGKGYLDFALWAVAEWGGKQRMLFVNLLHRNKEYAGGVAGQTYEFNWPVQEDTLYPGADLAFFEAEALPALCNYTVPVMSGAIGQEINYTVDLQKLFRCASDQGLFRDPMPTTANLPIKTVGWKNEGLGLSGGIWTSVHGMSMVP